jgi:hypothetical protein
MQDSHKPVGHPAIDRYRDAFEQMVTSCGATTPEEIGFALKGWTAACDFLLGIAHNGGAAPCDARPLTYFEKLQQLCERQNLALSVSLDGTIMLAPRRPN